MMSIWDWLLNPSGLTAHGFCLSWAPGLIALHAGSDAVIGLAYLSIPLALVWFMRQRGDLEYSWIIYSFVAFILLCGSTHLLAILTLWVPAYGVEGLVKLATALISIATAAMLWPLVPRLVALPSPAQLGRLNSELSARIAEHERTSALLRDSEARGRAANADLERRVAERTADLSALNAVLTEALAERARAQQALARSEAEFRAGFDAAAVGKLLTEQGTRRILRVNRAFARMLGYDMQDLLGRDSAELLAPEDWEPNAIGYARLLAGELGAFVRESRLIRRDGTPLWTRISTSIAPDPATGEPMLAVAVVEDIDARRSAEAALRAAKSDLEHVVGERTAALEQRDLLLREVYHRVKNNLQIVDSLLTMQARELEDARAKAALAALRGRIYALGLVHQQLMGSADLKTFDVEPFLRILANNVLEGGSRGGVVLQFETCPLQVNLDFAVPLGLMVTELVTNALKHAFPSGGGVITVLLQPENDERLVLVVADDGGAPNPQNAPPSKTGLGLSIVRGLVAQVDGTMITKYENGTRTEIRTPMPVQP